MRSNRCCEYRLARPATSRFQANASPSEYCNGSGLLPRWFCLSTCRSPAFGIGARLALEAVCFVLCPRHRNRTATHGNVTDRAELIDIGRTKIQPLLWESCRQWRKLEKPANRHGKLHNILRQTEIVLPAFCKKRTSKMTTCRTPQPISGPDRDHIPVRDARQRREQHAPPA